MPGGSSERRIISGLYNPLYQLEMNGIPFIGELSFLILLIIILAIISIVLSVISLLFVRSAARRMAGPPQPPAPSVRALPAPPQAPSPKPAMPKPAPAKAAARAEVKPPPPRPLETLEIKPAEVGEEFGFASLEEVASMLGVKSVILLNQSGIPIDSYNVGEDDRVAASVADFISLVRRLNPGFNYMISEDEQRVMLFVVGRIGESEIYALTVGGGPEFGVEEVRDMLRAYLSESLGRFK
ncbi:MAG: roadblock/LC7 domain-containing protein [Nitrososphaerota archaeon]